MKSLLSLRPGWKAICRRRMCVALSVGLLLTGCGSTQLVRNEDATAAVKDKSFGSYSQVLLLPPKDDRRKVVPRVVAEFRRMGYEVEVLDPAKPVEAAQGTGFLITSAGHLLTAAHVVGDHSITTVDLGGTRRYAKVLASDKEKDVALLQLETPASDLPAPLSLCSGSRYGMGEEVFTIGFPLSRLLGNSARMSKGLVSATTGIRDNPAQVQISAEIQPGNSGGPLLDKDGQVLGIVVQTINPWKIAQSTGGALPQNINFSVKNDPVVEFLKSTSPETYAALSYDRRTTFEDAHKAVVKVLAGRVAPEHERGKKLFVRFEYQSIWDLWYRFRSFVVSVYDYDAEELLFVAGQGRDNMVSTEDVVIKDTLVQVRKGLGFPVP